MNKMMRLDECCQIEISSIDKKSKENEEVVKLCNFTDVYYNWNIYKSMSDEFMTATTSDKNIEIFSLKEGDVVITKDSETRDDIGMSALIYEDIPKTVLGYHCALIRPKNIVDGAFLNAYLNSNLGRKHFENQASGSGQRYTLTKEGLGSIKIPIIPIKEQGKIGGIFSVIDRKIQNNNKINTELESMAKTLYDYWFLQFEFPNEEGKPYKSSGGKMVWNEELKREIPEGWEDTSLNFITDTITKGTTPSTLGYDFTDYGVNFVKVESINDGQINSELLAHISNEAHAKMERSSLKKDDILLTIAGRLGTTCVVSENILPANTNQAVAIIRLKKEYRNLVRLIYETLLSDETQTKLLYVNAQSIQKNLNLKNVGDISFALPLKDTLERYNRIIEPIFENIENNNIENQELTSLRDFLLPLLMNGQVGFRE